jgi:hypothetical protein
MSLLPPFEIARTETVTRALSDLVAEAPLEIRLRGASMEPLLGNADTVIVSSARRFWPGDILLFRDSQDQLVTHRLLGGIPTRAGWRFILRGDACSKVDGGVRREQICGRVVGVRRGGLGESTPLRPAWPQRGRALLGLLRYGLSRL